MKTTETGLETINEETGEISSATSQAEAVSRVQSSIIIAKRFPRDENQAFQSLMKTCKRPSFADTVIYAFPRGRKTITGPSVSVAREAARVWGNIHYGLKVITDSDTDRTVRGWAWDVESNAYVEAEDNFKKVVQRRQFDNKGVHIGTADEVASERDLRELTNRRGAILVRNCILQLLPKDLIEDAIVTARETLSSQAKNDPDAYLKNLIKAFGGLNIYVSDLEEFIKGKINRITSDQLTELRTVYKAISEGGMKWADFIHQEDTAEVSIANLTDKTETETIDKPREINPDRLKRSTGKINEDQRLHLEKLALECGWSQAKFADLLGFYGAESLTDLHAREFKTVEQEIQQRGVVEELITNGDNIQPKVEEITQEDVEETAQVITKKEVQEIKPVSFQNSPE